MDNGDRPASPIFNEDGVRLEQTLYDGLVIGLTKREEFAKAAMEGMCVHPVTDLRVIAIAAVEMADALLAALENKQ